MNTQKFVYVSYIKTTPEILWNALTTAKFTKQYWSGYSIESEWKVGSDLKFYNADGELAHQDKVLIYDKPRILSYSWTPLLIEATRGEASSKVTFELEPNGEVVKLTVTHFDFPENSKMFPMISTGWPAVLSGLKTFLESGEILSNIGCSSKKGDHK